MDWMLTSTLFINLYVYPPFFYFTIQFIKCKWYFFFFKNIPKIKILFQIKKLVNKIQLTCLSIKECNFLVFMSASISILISVVVRWFSSKKSSNCLLNFAYILLSLFMKLLNLLMKLVEHNPSEDHVFNFVVVIVVVTFSPISH